MEFECSCDKCENRDVRDSHELCACFFCHENGGHDEDMKWWAEECVDCKAALEASDERHDLQKGDLK